MTKITDLDLYFNLVPSQFELLASAKKEEEAGVLCCLGELREGFPVGLLSRSLEEVRPLCSQWAQDCGGRVLGTHSTWRGVRQVGSGGRNTCSAIWPAIPSILGSNSYMWLKQLKI